MPWRHGLAVFDSLLSRSAVQEALELDAAPGSSAHGTQQQHEEQLELLAATLLVVLLACLCAQLVRSSAGSRHARDAAAEPSRARAPRQPHAGEPARAAQLQPQRQPQPQWSRPAHDGSRPPQPRRSPQPLDRPFRFRAADAADAADDDDAAGGELGTDWQFPSSSQRQRPAAMPSPPPAFSTPPRPRAAEQQGGDAGGVPSSWDARLLLNNSPYASSFEALQCSPLFRAHVSQVRGRRLNYESAEAHKLRVYKALREVDPQGFEGLFSRRDVQEWDDEAPSRLLAAFECVASAALTLGLLGAPWLLPGLARLRAGAAAAWLLLQLLAARAGCTSIVARLLSLYATHGQYSMAASAPRLVAAMALEAVLLLATAGVGLSLSLGCRLLTAQRQSFSERLLDIVPLREVVRPMHFAALSPARGIS